MYDFSRLVQKLVGNCLHKRVYGYVLVKSLEVPVGQLGILRGRKLVHGCLREVSQLYNDCIHYYCVYRYHYIYIYTISFLQRHYSIASVIVYWYYCYQCYYYQCCLLLLSWFIIIAIYHDYIIIICYTIVIFVYIYIHNMKNEGTYHTSLHHYSCNSQIKLLNVMQCK